MTKKNVLFSEMACLSCLHYLGSNKCVAFPNGIPIEIIRGETGHDKRLPGQDNNLVWTDDFETASKAFDKAFEIEE